MEPNPKSLKLPQLNLVIIAGRFTADPILRHTQSGIAVLGANIAVSRRYKAKNSEEWLEEVAFIKINAWGDLATRTAERFKKGSPTIVEGSLKTNAYTDKQGTKRQSLEVLARRIQNLEKLEKKTEEVYEDIAGGDFTAGAQDEDVP